MTNRDRRKLAKQSICKHITRSQREENKEKDGKSSQPFNRDQRRYVHKLNNYYPDGASVVHPIDLKVGY